LTALELGLRFLVAELGALAALAWWGFARGGVLAVLSGILLPLAVAAVWGAFIGPRARRRLPDPPRLVLELLVFAAATAALAAVGHAVLATAYAVIAVATAVVTRAAPD